MTLADWCHQMLREQMPSGSLEENRRGAIGMSRVWMPKKLRDYRLKLAYRRLFFDDDDRLRADARMIIDDLIEKAGIGMASAGLEHEELACREGERRLFLHIMGRFAMRGAQLQQLIRDLERRNDRNE